MDALTIFQKIAEVTNMGPLEVTMWLIIVALFVWLYREFKTQYQKNKDLHAAKTEKSIANISKSLSAAYQYKSDNSKGLEFFVTVFDCFSSFDSYDIKDIKKIINDNSIKEKEKIEEISKKLYQQLIYLSERNKELNGAKSGIEILDYGLNKVKDIIYPIGQAFLTLFATLCIFIIISISDNIILNFIRLTAVFLIIILPVGFIDFYQKEKLKKNSIISIILIIISLIFLIFQYSTLVVIFFLVIFVVSLTCLFKFGLKR
ncbi:hypothetical protein M3685_11640 [Heyndrickxia oleronia]|nr:hypothetical protein [Heyndrickxia oleronia]MCM3454594.1 hypothetical protein [Heyndrickxia oleronia]MEC1377306.1 hypothetical protein [Heyndrickxia oleronia]OJH17193.1 hypothetical protein BLX88_19410 [Bacillus obstructivus]QQZ03899.1 hypothetical protein I5818_19520 [Heyndrickxia oleronia]